MMSKRMVRIVCTALAVLMALSILAPLLYTSFAEAPPAASGSLDAAASSKAASDKAAADKAASKAAVEAQKNELKDKLSGLQKELETINNDIKANKDNLNKKEQTKKSYQQQANTIAAQIEVLKTDIANKEAELRAKQIEVEQKVLQVADTKATFEARLKAMYMMKNDSNLSTLLGATTFSSGLRYAENLQQISVSDTNLIAKLRTEEAELETQAAEVQAALDDLNASNEELEAKKQEYAASIQKVNKEIDQTEADLQAQEVAYGDKKAQQEAAMKEWNSFAQANPSVGFVWDGGVFSWPIPGYYRLSSDFGVYRVINGVADVHRGMDVPAPTGVPIYAAADGVVSTTAHWSYGTCVKLDHGSGLVTIYGHMSARFVSNGQFVTKGTPIGAVGSTGNSYGAHLHFEVDLNGRPVNGHGYLDPAVDAQLHF
ncbi:MAG: peptidoglycan DD-metalloendopeptidase family protein [Ruthenibacterium sp.]